MTVQGQSRLHHSPPKPAARSRLIIGDFGPSDSALAAARGWRLRRPAADRHAARCASRDLCSGGAPRRYPPSNVIHIRTPPLREMRDDIPLLASTFLSKFCNEARREPKKLAPDALRRLMAYAWPGNVRELENEMRRVVALSTRKVVTEEDLSDSVRNGSESALAMPVAANGALKDTVASLEKRLIIEALQARRNNQQQAAKLLGLSRQGLIKKMKRYGVKAV